MTDNEFKDNVIFLLKEISGKLTNIGEQIDYSEIMGMVVDGLDEVKEEIKNLDMSFDSFTLHSIEDSLESIDKKL